MVELPAVRHIALVHVLCSKSSSQKRETHQQCQQAHESAPTSQSTPRWPHRKHRCCPATQSSQYQAASPTGARILPRMQPRWNERLHKAIQYMHTTNYYHYNKIFTKIARKWAYRRSTPSRCRRGPRTSRRPCTPSRCGPPPPSPSSSCRPSRCPHFPPPGHAWCPQER